MTKTKGRATVDKAGYRDYIKSAAWRAKRKAFIDSKLRKECWGCGKPWGKGDHLHHRTYKNLGNERLMDLVPLCSICHARVHEIYEDPKWKAKGLWYATRQVIKQKNLEKMVIRTNGFNPSH